MNMEIVPKQGIRGLVENWQSDLIAAVSVSLVAMPLALGIAFASKAPPMAGVFSAIIGGVVTTFFRGSHIAINGPAAGLIAVILGSIIALEDGQGQTLNYVFAAIVVAGAIQILLGLLKLGRFAEIFHSSVIHGIMAAIGVIIIAKQIHVALGTESDSPQIVETLINVFEQLPNINPFVAFISFVGLILLIFHSKISYKFFHFLPAPMWVLVISIPFVYFFNFFETHSINFFGKFYEIGPELLITLPDNILDAIAYPNFSKIHTLEFWASVISITLIASIQTLAMAKAIDKLDPYKRKTDLNKDLVGVGISTMVAGALGGLPIINVIVRSTVNVQNHAKTKWSNLYHGLLLLLIIFLLSPIIQLVPLCALAIILVYTGFKLASPKVFKHVYEQGIEQLIFFVGTLVITLFTDLLIGILGGLLLALLSHLLLARVPIYKFFQMIFYSGSNILLKQDGTYQVNIKGIANFLSTLNINKLLAQIPPGSQVDIELSKARLVDFSILENLYEFQRTHNYTQGKVNITGLDKHISSSNHKLALKVLISSADQLSNRQVWLKAMAEEHNWSFNMEHLKHAIDFQTFDFFRSRPIENTCNFVSYEAEEFLWQIIDVTFEEGAFMSSEEYRTTLGLVKFPFNIPSFTMEKKGFLDKYLHIAEHKDIDYTVYHDFSNEFIIKVENKEEMDVFLTKKIRSFFENSGIHHIESNGESLLIFKEKLKLAQIGEYAKMIKFAEDFKEIIQQEKGDAQR